MNSGHKVEVVPVNLEKHPNADALSINRVFGYQVCCQTEAWKDAKVAAWIPPDTLVDTRRPEFDWLNDGKNTLYFADGYSAKQKVAQGDDQPVYHRVRMKKLRNVVSYGLLVPAPDGAQAGDNVADKLGTIHWNPPEPPDTKGEVASPPPIYFVKYDVDSFQRYAQEVFVPGEAVVVTEKIHGANGRWVFWDGQFYCGSRTEWKKEFGAAPNKDKILEDMHAAGCPPERMQEVQEKLEKWTATQNMWWKALRQYPDMMDWLALHPGAIMYGEVYGQVQDLKYGAKPGELKIAIFDIMIDGKWLDFKAARIAAPAPLIPWVPLVAEGIPFDFDKLVAMAEMKSMVPGAEGQIAEGIVVKPLVERQHDAVGRVQLKIVSQNYLGRKEKE